MQDAGAVRCGSRSSSVRTGSFIRLERLEAPALQAAREAVAGLREARGREGERLAAVLLERIGHLRTLTA